MQMVDSWIARGQDYFEGLKVLEYAGSSGFMLDMLADGPGEYNTPKLLQEILKLQKLEVTEPEPDNAVATPLPAAVPYMPNKDLEKSIRLKDQIFKLFKEIGHLKPQLLQLRSKSKRYECARAIATRDMRKQDLWEHLHYFEENGQWFDELPENQPKPYDLEKDIKNQMANRSKASAQLDTPLPVAKKKYYQDKVAALTLKIENLKKLRING